MKRSLVEKIRDLPMELATPLEIDRADQTSVLFSQQKTLSVPADQLQGHMAILGTTGAGKSRMVQGICQHLITTMQGFTFIDPHGDTAEALLDYCLRQSLRKGEETVLPRLHYLEPAEHRMFAFDPLNVRRDWNESADTEFAYATRIRTRAKSVVDVLLRRFSGTDKDAMRRLGRWLENAIVVLATPLPSGARLAFSDILLLLQPNHPQCQAIIARLRRHLPSAVLDDFDYLMSLPRRRDQDFYLESSANNIRAYTDEVTEVIFGNHGPPLDFEQIIRKREILIVNLRESQCLHRSTSRSIADFIIDSVSAAAAGLPAAQRTPHTLFIDEASQFVAEDLGDYLDQSRKFKLFVALIGQQLSSFQRGDTNIGDQVMSHCKLFASFQQKNPYDVETLGKFFADPNLVLEEGTQRAQVPDPSQDRVVQLVDRGIGTTISRGDVVGFANAVGQADSIAENQSTTHAEGISQSTGSGTMSGSGLSSNFVNIDGQIIQMPASSYSDGASDFIGSGTNQSDAQTSGTSKARSKITTQAQSQSKITSTGASESMTIKQSLVAGTKSVFDPNGQPRYALPYQYAMSQHLLTTLPERCCLIRGRIDGIEQTILVRTPDVPDPLPPGPETDEKRQEFLEKLYASKDYFFRPSNVRANAEQRIVAFLQAPDETETLEAPTSQENESESGPLPPPDTPDLPQGF